MSTETIKPVGNMLNVRVGMFGYKPYEGYQIGGLVSAPQLIRWDQCRDRIQLVDKHVIDTFGLWFCHRKNCGLNIKFFLKKIEQTLKIKSKSVFAITDHPERCMWMKPSPWWSKNLIRRSFLTLSLRAGQNYKLKKDNFLESFKINKYGKGSMEAIKLFFNGYNHYYGRPLHMFEGWSHLFKNANEKQIKELLSKRTSKIHAEQHTAIW